MQKIRSTLWIKRAALFLAAMLLMATAGAVASAQTISGGFSIRAVIPENQIDTRQTYFDLLMKPAQEQTVQVTIINSREEALVVNVALNAASTARNGLIAYTEPDVRDDSMELSISDVASLRVREVTVPAKGTQTVDIDIKMPGEPFSGVLLGGIVVTESGTKNPVQTAQGVSISNTISYVLALKLTQDKNADMPPDFELSSVAPKLVNHRTAVVATLHNTAARIVKEMKLTAKVYRKGDDAVLHELLLDNAEMAPLSKGDFVVDWENQPLQAGTYRLHLIAQYDSKIWEWDEEFTIASEADELNREAVGIEKDYTWLYILLGLLLAAIIGFAAYLFGKRRNRDENPRVR